MFRGDRLRSLRLERKYSQEKLAELLVVGKRQITRYESGETDPSSKVVTNMAQLFNVSADYLLGNTDDPNPSFDQPGLSEQERAIIAALRRGQRLKAIQIIADDRSPA